MPTVARWGTSAATIEKSDWVCNKDLGKVSLINADVCQSNAPVVAPVKGPANLSAVKSAPLVGPGSLSAVLLAPTTGPSSLGAIKLDFNIAPLETDQTTFADDPNSGVAGDIKYSSDAEHLYIHDGTEWHHTEGRQPGEPYTVI